MQDQREWLKVQIEAHKKLFNEEKDAYWKDEITILEGQLEKLEAEKPTEVASLPPAPVQSSAMEVVPPPLSPIVSDDEEVVPAMPEYDITTNILMGCISRLNSTAHIYKALEHFQKGNFRRAIWAAEKCVNNKVEANLAHYIMALSYHARKNPHAATACFKNIPINANPSEVITDLDFHGNAGNWVAKVGELQQKISDMTLSHQGSSDIQRALKHFRKKNFIKAMSLAKGSIREGIEVSFAHLIIAMSVYQCEEKNFEHVRDHLNYAEQFARNENDNNSPMKKFAEQWVSPLISAVNIKLEDVAACIARNLNDDFNGEREKLKGLVRFDGSGFVFDSKIDRYTTYKILQRLHADKAITSKEFVGALKTLQVREAENPSLHEKVARQITRHNTNIVGRAGSYGAHLARNFFKAARDKYYVNAFMKFADEMRKQKINGLGDIAFHVIPHAVPLIFDLLAYAAYSIAAAVRWLVSPFMGYRSAKASETNPVAALPVVNKEPEGKAFKFYHVKHGAGLGFFAKAVSHRVKAVSAQEGRRLEM